MYGKDCAVDSDCDWEIFACYDGKCSCSIHHGFTGDGCTETSEIHVILDVIVLVAICPCIFLSIKVLYLYVIRPIIETYKSRRIIVVESQQDTARSNVGTNSRRIIALESQQCLNANLSSEEAKNATQYDRRYPALIRLRSKDRAAISNLMFGISATFLHFFRLLAHTAGSPSSFETIYSIENTFAPFTFFFLTWTQLELGLAWLEVYLAHSLRRRLSFIHYMRKAVNMLVLGEAFLLSIMLALLSIHQAVVVTSAFLFIIPVVCSFGGWNLSKKMLKLDHQSRIARRGNYDFVLFKEAMSIRRTIKAMLFCFLMIVVSSAVTGVLNFLEAYAVAFTVVNISFMLIQILILRYIDRNGWIFGNFSNLNSIVDPNETRQTQNVLMSNLGQFRTKCSSQDPLY